MIAIVTEDSRFYYKIVKELEKKNTQFVTLKTDQKIPSYIDIVITTNREKDKIHFENTITGDKISEIVERAINYNKGTKNPIEKLIIGIDPGTKPGLVAIGDKTIIYKKQLKTPEQATTTIQKILKRYKAEKTLIKVGSGGGTYQTRILKTLQDNFNIPIEIVDEISTTPNYKKNPLQKQMIKDIAAAINIALKEGHTLKKQINIKPKKGEIKNIQKESRKKSQDITISATLAEKVIKGEISLNEAIKKQRQKTI